MNKTLSKEEENELSLVHEDDLQELQDHFDNDEWIAIKSLSSLASSISTTNHIENVNNKYNDEIINIVSLSVENEKVRKHRSYLFRYVEHHIYKPLLLLNRSF
jgi:hypothetical protein